MFCREKLDHRVKRTLRMCVFLKVGRVCVPTIFYSPQAPMKRVWNPLLPRIDITKQCESLCRTSLGFWRWDRMNTIVFGYILIKSSRDAVVSLACYSYFKFDRLGGFKSWRMTFSMEMSRHRFFENFKIKIRAQTITFSSKRIVLYYIDIHKVHERENVPPWAHIFPGLLM